MLHCYSFSLHFELKGNEAYDFTLNDLIPTKEDVVYDEAILHRENVAYGCIVNQTQETLDMKGNEAYGCTASDFIPTGENVTYYYDQAILPVNISTRKNIAYGHVTH